MITDFQYGRGPAFNSPLVHPFCFFLACLGPFEAAAAVLASAELFRSVLHELQLFHSMWQYGSSMKFQGGHVMYEMCGEDDRPGLRLRDSNVPLRGNLSFSWLYVNRSQFCFSCR